MSESALQRSIRRGTAVLLVPLSLLLIQVEVVTRNLSGVVESSLPGLSRGVGVALLVAALLYLLASGARQLYLAADTPF
ncbi:hypothetical protein [Halobellus limi]|jgi:phosphoglycerol transferase MdoB-like AlkP superfamily enzyme|uniref:Uncharacterized protein n=1 Tax=Halobellus limi TaxID=699433 RepID=A0A1H6CLE5_9EURY|nr:hypothetical protein [Halobellus limi]QCC48775.1 hypothetical protein DV707_14560 [Halobellus limi]SEG73513.1 hypothetical protein SAMN04488133_3507 [Halobellus limi]